MKLLEQIRKHQAESASNYQVARLGVFGPAVRGRIQKPVILIYFSRI